MRGYRRSAGLVIGAVVCGLGAWRLAATGAEAPGQGAPAPVERLAGLVEAFPDPGFERPSGPWTLSLPADHGAHPAARMETWAISARLEDEAGRTMGLHFLLARLGLDAAPADEGAPWEPRALWVAGVALAGEGESAVVEERLSRGALGSAGHDDGTVWLDDWSIDVEATEEGARLTLDASIGARPLSLALTPVKPAVAAGEGEDAPARGFAVSRLAVDGTLGAGETHARVTGLAWLDRLWGEVPLPGGPVAYDRLSVQLDDGTDLALVRTRRRDGRGSATVEGTAIGADGVARPLGPAVAMTPTAAAEGDYPLSWRVEGEGLDLDVAPAFESRPREGLLPAWNGLVRVAGRREGRAVAGTGTLQLTGYATR